MRQSKLQNSLYLAIATLTCATLATDNAQAEKNYSVYGIRTDFPMAENQNIPKDFYINMGAAQGLKDGTTLDVFRNLPTTDEANQKNAQNINFKIARLKVIHVENNVAVARLISMQTKDTPNAVYNTVMVGDYVEVSRK